MPKRKSRPIKSKVRLDKLIGENWWYCSCGSIWPNPIEVGEGVNVGSISSRDIWTTTKVVEIVSDAGKEIVFNTESGSTYRITWII